MSITLTGTGGLFTRLGKIAGGLNESNGFLATIVSPVTGSGGTTGTRATTIQAQYESADQNVIDSLFSQRNSFQASNSSWTSYLQTLASNTLTQQVNTAYPLTALTPTLALTALIAGSSTFTVNASVPTVKVGAASASTISSHALTGTGNGVLTGSVVRYDGTNLQYVLAETIAVTITSDNQVGATSGSEPASVLGQIAESNPLAYDWPLGTGVSSTLTAVNAAVSNGANLLFNSSFNTYSVTNQADNWVYTQAVTTFFAAAGSGSSYDSINALQFTGGDGSTLHQLNQTFNSSSGTTSKLSPSTIYALNLWAKGDSSNLMVFNVNLVDGAGTVINDTAGTANTLSVTVPTTYTAFTKFFRTPAVLPTSGIKLQIIATTALASGKNAYLDHLSLTLPTQIYPGGPSLALFSGSIPFITGDTTTVLIANTWGLMQAAFEQFFGMKTLGLQLPNTVSSPTISDSLVV